MLHRLCPVEPPVLPQNQCGYCGLQFGNSRIYIEHMVEVSKNLKRIKIDKIEEAPTKIPKLEEDAMEIDNVAMMLENTAPLEEDAMEIDM
jgi:hypothetical protein